MNTRMEESTLNLSYKNDNSYNKVENTASITNLCGSSVVVWSSGDILPLIYENESSMDKINQCFGRLNIQSYVEFNKGKNEYLIGEITSIIAAINIVVVKPISLNILLYLGTPLFLSCRNIQNGKAEYTLLGYINDIFGAVEEPMYSVTIKCNSTEALNINAQVYCFSNHPKTLQMYLEYITDKMSRKRNYKIKTKRLKHRL